MLAASLVERHLGTRRSKRESAAFHLSWAREGRTRLRYVAKDRLGGPTVAAYTPGGHQGLYTLGE